MTKPQRSKLQINYKSGQSVTVTVEEFSVRTNALGERSFEWKAMVPRPLILGADDVESVWEFR